MKEGPGSFWEAGHRVSHSSVPARGGHGEHHVVGLALCCLLGHLPGVGVVLTISQGFRISALPLKVAAELDFITVGSVEGQLAPRHSNAEASHATAQKCPSVRRPHPSLDSALLPFRPQKFQTELLIGDEPQPATLSARQGLHPDVCLPSILTFAAASS